MSLYRDLDIDEDASDEQIKQAYRRKARIHHPDAGGDEDEFKRISFAYNVLSDPGKRANYDKTGQTEKPDPKNAAKQVLANLYANCILQQNIDPDSVDIPQVLNRTINAREKKFLREKKLAETLIKKFENAGGRFSSKKENFFKSVSDDKIKQLNAELNNVLMQIEICKEMKVMLDEYDYRVDVCRDDTATSTSTENGIRISFGTY